MKMQVDLGDDIHDAIVRACDLSREADDMVVFSFNEITVAVLGDSEPDLVYRDWQRAIRAHCVMVIGPKYAATLTPKEIALDKLICRGIDERRAKQQAEYDAQKEAKRVAADAELAGSEPMLFSGFESGQENWQRGLAANSEPYGRAVYTFAERWARMMQVRMKAHRRGGAGRLGVADVAEEASHEADVEGITGSMYGCAVGVLFKCWIHGDELRRWHNLNTQICDEGERANEGGGVLNPALLTIGGKQDD